jgi:hypothetical protein
MPRTTNKTNSNSYTTKQNIPPPIKSPPLQNQPLPLQNQPPTMWDSVKQGFSFGIGSSIAHNIFRSKDVNKDINKDINKDVNKDETNLTTDKMYESYIKCLEKNDNNIDCTIILQNNNNIKN